MDAFWKTIRGDRSLPITYWLWFVLPALAINIANAVFTTYLDQNPTYPFNDASTFWTIIGVLLFLQVLVTYVIGYGVIQSAMRRVPKGIWGVLAIIVAVLGMIRLPFLYYQQLSPLWQSQDLSTAESVRIYQEQILREARAAVPQKVDDITTLTGFTFEDKTFVYQYEVTAEPDFKPDGELLKTKQLEAFCETLKSIKMPGVIEATKYHYTIGDSFVSFVVDDNDCDGR